MRHLPFLIILTAFWGVTTPGYAQSDDSKGGWLRLQNNPGCSVWDDNPLPNETVSWTGSCQDGLAHGTGIKIWRFMEDGVRKTQRYEGDMRFGKVHGRGVHVFASGNRYEGDYRDNKRHGRGVFVWADGNKYEGDWKADRKDGRGVFVWANGELYDGEWKDDKFHGRGALVYANGDIYKGDFRDGKANGRGVMVFASGARYEGEFQDNALHGRGVLMWGKGGRLEGSFVNGSPEGPITKTTPDGTRLFLLIKDGKIIEERKLN